MQYRSYTAQFFQAECLTIPEAQKEDILFQLFRTEKGRTDAGNQPTLAATASGYQCELRDLTIHASTVMGCVGLLRPDAPHIRGSHGAERLIPINPGDQFLEKNYFIYFKQRRLIVWQYNLAANHINNLGLLLTSISSNTHTVSCHVLLENAFAFDENVEIKLVDFRVRCPKTHVQRAEVAELNPNQWAANPFQIMADTEAKAFALTLSTGRGQSNLGGRVKTMVRGLLSSSQTRRLRVKMGDAEEPIDLLAKRVKRRVQVQMDGLYPIAASAWQELQAAKDDANEEIERCL